MFVMPLAVAEMVWWIEVLDGRRNEGFRTKIRVMAVAPPREWVAL